MRSDPPGMAADGTAPWRGRGGAEPDLSVVVLTYNSAGTVEACLDSLVAQQFSDFDTIVVDDLSTDDTTTIVSGYEDRLRLSLVPNGSHNIPKGRNIGLARATSDVVAFLDSDDTAHPDWARVIVDTFAERPELALIGGDQVSQHRTTTSRAIGLNDAVVRKLTARGVMQFCAGNCAINQRVIPGPVFDEEFLAAEDLELVSRVQKRFECASVPEMQIQHASRDTLRQYAKQMYRYGYMKLLFNYCERSYRWIDFVPLGIMVGGVAAAVAIGPWWLAVAIVPFSLLEALFVVIYSRCRPAVALLSFPAWMTKNITWSAGIAAGVAALTRSPETRRRLRSKRPDLPAAASASATVEA